MPAPQDDHNLALWFTPQAIREHFQGGDHFQGVEAEYEKIINDLTDAELRAIGEDALYDNDELYQAFHRGLLWALVSRGLVSEDDM